MKNIYLHYLYWTLVFFQGIIKYIGAPTSIYKFGAPFIVLILFIDLALKKNLKITPFLGWVLFFIIISFFSNFIGKSNLFSLIYFLRYSLLSYLYFLIIINDYDNEKYINIAQYIIFLFILQIPADILKYIFIGQREGVIIGTISVEAGVVSTVLPTFAISVLFSLYLFHISKKYLILIFGFILCGIIGAKRGIIFFIPLTILVTYFLYNFLSNRLKTYKFIKNSFFVLIISMLAFILIAKTNPTLNPEGSNWGSFDLDYIINYSQDYTSTQDLDPNYYGSRKDALFYFFETISKSNFKRFVLGDGAGMFIESRYNSQAGEYDFYDNVKIRRLTGATQFLIQLGLIGTIVYMMFIFRAFYFVYINYRYNPLYLAFLSLTFVFITDFIFYSVGFYKFEFLKGVYFFILGVLYLDIKSSGKYLNSGFIS